MIGITGQVLLPDFILQLPEVKRISAQRLNPSLPVIYLDYDGVLHSDNVYWYRRKGIVVEADHSLFAAAAILESILMPYPTVQLILSTTWVRVMTYHKAAKRLPIGLQKRLCGATWHSNIDADFWSTLTRYEQIAKHAKRHSIKNWLAIDNDAEGWSQDETDRLVCTSDSCGLLEPESQKDLQRKLALLC